MNKKKIKQVNNVFFIVVRVTGITQTMLGGERPLTVVLPLFIEWLVTTVQQVSDATSTTHFPGMLP